MSSYEEACEAVTDASTCLKKPITSPQIRCWLYDARPSMGRLCMCNLNMRGFRCVFFRLSQLATLPLVPSLVHTSLFRAIPWIIADGIVLKRQCCSLAEGSPAPAR